MDMTADLADSELHAQAAAFGTRLLEARLKLATAESCTGGWVAKVVTEVPGSSAWFDCAFVAYSYDAKEAMLGSRGGSATTVLLRRSSTSLATATRFGAPRSPKYSPAWSVCWPIAEPDPA